MKNTKNIAIVAVALSGMAAAETSLSASAGFHSKYLFRGIDFAITPGGEGENSLIDYGIEASGSADAGFDWYAGTWYGSTTNGSAYNETDIYAGITYGAFDFGAVTYTYDDGTENDSEVYIGYGTTFAGIDFSSTTSIGTGGSWKNGVWQSFALSTGVEFADWVSGSFEAQTGLAFGQAGYSADVDGFANFTFTFALDFVVNDATTFSPYITYVGNSNTYAANSAANGNTVVDSVVVGGSLSTSF